MDFHSEIVPSKITNSSKLQGDKAGYLGDNSINNMIKQRMLRINFLLELWKEMMFVTLCILGISELQNQTQDSGRAWHLGVPGWRKKEGASREPGRSSRITVSGPGS